MSDFFNVTRQRSLYANEAERHLPLVQRKLTGIEEDMSSGKRINRPSDNPSGFARASRIDALQKENKSYIDTIKTARGWVTSTEDALDQMVDLFAQAGERAIQARNDTLGQDERDAIAKELGAIKNQVVTLSNTRYSGEYIFAGNKTTTPPFQDDGSPTTNLSDLDGDRKRTTGPGGLQISVNIDGQELSEVEPGGLKTIGALDDLIQSLKNGDAEGISQSIEDTEEARSHFAQLGSKAGSVARRLDSMATQLRGVNHHLEAERSEIEDTDYLKALVDFQRTQQSLEASLKVTTEVRQTTILDYLR